MYIPYLVYQSVNDHLNWFPSFGCCEWCFNEHGVQIPLWDPYFHSFAWISRIGIARSHCGSLFCFCLFVLYFVCFVCSFLWHPYHFTFPANMHKCFYVSTLTPTLWTKLPFEIFIQVKRRVNWLKAQVVLGYHRSCEGHVLRSDSGPCWPGSELPMSLPPLWGQFSDSTTYNSPLLLQ